MQPKQNTFQALRDIIAAVGAIAESDGAAPVAGELITIRAALQSTLDTLARCNIDTLPPGGTL